MRWCILHLFTKYVYDFWKKIIAIVLISIILLSTAGCGDIINEIFDEYGFDSIADNFLSDILDMTANSEPEISDKEESSEEILPDYAPYDSAWVRYWEQTDDPDRLACLEKAQKMVTVLWKAPCDFATWRSSKGELNTTVSVDNVRAQKFIAGKIYMGIPYSMNNHSYNDEKWLELVSKGFESSDIEAGYYTGSKLSTAKGIDCSYFVYEAIKAAGFAVEYQTTTTMINSKYYKRLVGFDDMIPGDILIKSGHTRLYIGKNNSNGKYAFFEATADGSKCGYFEYASQQLKSEGYNAYRFKDFN